MDDYVTKPVSLAAIDGALQRALRHDRRRLIAGPASSRNACRDCTDQTDQQPLARQLLARRGVPSPEPRRRMVGAVLLFFVVVALVLNRELLPHLTDALPGNAGDPMLNAWILSWVSDTAVSSPSALWNAPIFHPHPNALAFSEHLIGIAVFVAPIYWLTGDPILLTTSPSCWALPSLAGRCSCSCAPSPGERMRRSSPASS